MSSGWTTIKVCVTEHWQNRQGPKPNICSHILPWLLRKYDKLRKFCKDWECATENTASRTSLWTKYNQHFSRSVSLDWHVCLQMMFVTLHYKHLQSFRHCGCVSGSIQLSAFLSWVLLDYIPGWITAQSSFFFLPMLIKMYLLV